jgi:hypothetical protein
MYTDRFFREYSSIIAEECRTLLPRVKKCGVNNSN